MSATEQGAHLPEQVTHALVTVAELASRTTDSVRAISHGHPAAALGTEQLATPWERYSGSPRAEPSAPPAKSEGRSGDGRGGV